MKIYKFRSLNRAVDPEGNCARQFTIELLKSNKLWCPKPESLNDLLEIQPKIISDLNEDAFEAFLQWRKKTENLTQEHCRNIVAGYYEAVEKGLNIDFNETISKMIESIRSIGVCSFSMNWQVPMIWGTYADNGSGIAIEYEIPDDDIDRVFFKIQYVKSRETIDLCELFESMHLRKSRDAVHRKLICTKSIVWFGEEEIRSVVENGNNAYKIAGNFTKVFLGPKISKIDELDLRSFIDASKICNTKISDDHYAVEATP